MVNHLTMQGRFVADPELKSTNGGTSVTNFRVAWSEKYKENENKCFLECKAFGTQAEHVCRFFRKGQEAVVEGKLNTEEWENKEGQKRSKIVLMMSSIHFTGKKEDSGNASSVQPDMTPVDVDGELPF